MRSRPPEGGYTRDVDVGKPNESSTMHFAQYNDSTIHVYLWISHNALIGNYAIPNTYDQA